MAAIEPRYPVEEFARRGDELYDRDIRPRLGPDDEGKFVAIDIETGDYEVDGDEMTASERLRARIPGAQTWMRQVGSRYIRRFGFQLRTVSP
jgi:hypothetical protein